MAVRLVASRAVTRRATAPDTPSASIRALLFDEGPSGGRVHGPAEQKPLHLHAAVGFDGHELLVGLDALGGGLDPDAHAEIDDRLDERPAVLAVPEVADEPLVDLDLVKGDNRCTLLMNPSDLSDRKLADGDTVHIQSRAGGVNVPVESSDAVMPGVVSLPHGYGHDRDGVQMEVAQKHAGVSINDITDEQYLDKLSGNAALNGVPVTVAMV